MVWVAQGARPRASYRGEWAAYIVDLLRDRGLTTAELARLTRITPATLSKWLNGKQEPNALAQKSIARALRIPTFELLNRLGIVDDTTPGEAHQHFEAIAQRLEQSIEDLRSIARPNQWNTVYWLIEQLLDKAALRITPAHRGRIFETLWSVYVAVEPKVPYSSSDLEILRTQRPQEEYQRLRAQLERAFAEYSAPFWNELAANYILHVSPHRAALAGQPDPGRVYSCRQLYFLRPRMRLVPQAPESVLVVGLPYSGDTDLVGFLSTQLGLRPTDTRVEGARLGPLRNESGRTTIKAQIRAGQKMLSDPGAEARSVIWSTSTAFLEADGLMLHPALTSGVQSGNRVLLPVVVYLRTPKGGWVDRYTADLHHQGRYEYSPERLDELRIKLDSQVKAISRASPRSVKVIDVLPERLSQMPPPELLATPERDDDTDWLLDLYVLQSIDIAEWMSNEFETPNWDADSALARHWRTKRRVFGDGQA